MKLFVDTNVFADWLISTNVNHNTASQFIKECLLGRALGCVSIHSLTDLFYITRKYFSVEERKSFLRLILDRFVIVPENRSMISAVLDNPNDKDLEDGLQIQCAEKECVDFIVTENLKDFSHSSVKAISARQILAAM